MYVIYSKLRDATQLEQYVLDKVLMFSITII